MKFLLNYPFLKLRLKSRNEEKLVLTKCQFFYIKRYNSIKMLLLQPLCETKITATESAKDIGELIGFTCCIFL